MDVRERILTMVIAFLMLSGQESRAQDHFRVYPYVQNPTKEGISIRWFSEDDAPGALNFQEAGSGHLSIRQSVPQRADALAYSTWEDTTFFAGAAPAPPYLHRVRLEGLLPGTLYEYSVVQGTDTFTATFRTAPDDWEPIRFIVYADSETEPESTGNYTDWVDPVDGTSRSYLVDQTTGYHQNLEVIRNRHPDLIFIAGDLTQHGGEQRDWDEFWKHNTASEGAVSVAGTIPILAALGNHDYYEGNYLDGYDQPGSERAVRRFQTYFEHPPNQSPNPAQEGRYYCLTYGPVTFIVLDLCNNSPNGSDEDTNYYLLGEGDPDGGNAPDFRAGSPQYEWLKQQLEYSQLNSLFTFVLFHHVPYSVGPHGFPPGEGDALDTQSGVPVRVLTPLFMQYGVDALFCGHDEIWERSVLTGTEELPDSTGIPHVLQVYDVGTGGDGLRGPMEGSWNPYQEFLAHTDVPEVWADSILVEGGKHYGHLEVEILHPDPLTWQAVMTPAYIFPLFSQEDSTYTDFERREYPDQVILTRTLPDTTTDLHSRAYDTSALSNRPNPFSENTLIEFRLPDVVDPFIIITDIHGRTVRQLHGISSGRSKGQVWWDGCDERGTRVPPGIYIYSVVTPQGLKVSRTMLRAD
ncbi:MAG: metallophosphoesterase [Bacteroidales bacterium]